MTNNVSPEEVDALLGSDDAAAVGRVESRDFTQPRRLSLAQQRTIRTAVNKLIPQLEGTVRSWFQGDYAVGLTDVGETTAHGLFEELQDPIVVRNIEVDGAPGWVVWENAAAVAAATVAMSCELEEDAEPRPLTPLEAGLMGDFILSFTKDVASCLDLSVSGGPLSQTERSFLAQLDTDEDGDPQRLFLHFTLEGPGGPSTLRFYLPGILPEVQAVSEPPAALPQHLDHIPLEVSLELGSVEIELDDLMKLEVGDVIPLNSCIGDALDVFVEGRLTGKASWGKLRGHLAMNIEQLNTDL